MTGYDVQRFERFKKQCIDSKIIWMTSGENIHLKFDKSMLGSFTSIASASDYLYGFDAGYAKGRKDCFIQEKGLKGEDNVGIS